VVVREARRTSPRCRKDEGIGWTPPRPHDPLTARLQAVVRGDVVVEIRVMTGATREDIGIALSEKFRSGPADGALHGPAPLRDGVPEFTDDRRPATRAAPSHPDGWLDEYRNR